MFSGALGGVAISFVDERVDANDLRFLRERAAGVFAFVGIGELARAAGISAFEPLARARSTAAI